MMLRWITKEQFHTLRQRSPFLLLGFLCYSFIETAWLKPNKWILTKEKSIIRWAMLSLWKALPSALNPQIISEKKHTPRQKSHQSPIPVGRGFPLRNRILRDIGDVPPNRRTSPPWLPCLLAWWRRVITKHSLFWRSCVYYVRFRRFAYFVDLAVFSSCFPDLKLSVLSWCYYLAYLGFMSLLWLVFRRILVKFLWRRFGSIRVARSRLPCTRRLHHINVLDAKIINY